MRSLTMQICPFIHNVEKISGPKRSIKIIDHFTCTSANVIYCITCTYCSKLYIGETGRRLGNRFREHLRDMERNDKWGPGNENKNLKQISPNFFIFLFLLRFEVIRALSECTRTDKWSLFVNRQLLDEVEQNIMICQWQADQLITEAEAQGETLANHGILREPSSIIVLSFNHQACFFIV